MDYKRGDTMPHPDMEMVIRKLEIHLSNLISYQEYNNLHSNSHYWLGNRIGELLREYMCNQEGYKAEDFLDGIKNGLRDIPPEPVISENECFKEWELFNIKVK